MEINSFSKTDRLSGAFGSIFKFLFGWVLKIDMIMIFLMLGALGWIFGMYMDFISTAKIFGFVLVGTIIIAMFVVDTAEDLGVWLGFCFVLSGLAGFWFEGNVQTSTKVNTKTAYMVDAVLTGNSIEYIGGDQMTKIITIKDAEILSHYKKFKDSDRFTYMVNTTLTKNVILNYVGIDYEVDKKQWITLHDIKAGKDLFRIK